MWGQRSHRARGVSIRAWKIKNQKRKYNFTCFDAVVSGREEIGAVGVNRGAEGGRRTGGLVMIFSPSIVKVHFG